MLPPKPHVQRIELQEKWFVFETGDDGHTRLAGDDLPYALRTVLDTWLMQRDRPGFLDALLARTGQAWEGVLGYAYASEDPDAIPAGTVLVFFMDDDLLVDDTLFTALAMAQLKAHADATADPALQALHQRASAALGVS